MSACTSDNEMGNAYFREIEVTSSNHVKLSDVEKKITAEKPQTRAGQNDIHVMSYVDADQDTLLYIWNNPIGGWTIYSTDRRTPPVLVESETGDYNDFIKNQAASLWLKTMADDMKRIKQCKDHELRIPRADQYAYKKHWESISNPALFLEGHSTTRAIGGNPIIKPSGHYELFASNVSEQIYDEAGHLLETQWHQNSPYNVSCPYIGQFHAQAGCVAIAAAQVLYYLHYKIGVPTEAPDAVSVTGNVENNLSITPTSMSSTIWDSMPITPYPSNHSASPLVAHVGYLAETSYGLEESSAAFINLPNNVFPTYHISCVHSNINYDTLAANLERQMPVILGAHAGSDEGVGHCFVADAYRRCRMVYTNVYEWVYDFIPTGTPIPQVPPKTEITYSLPHVTYIKMNWGQDSQWSNNADNVWFALTGAWAPECMAYQNYSYRRSMVYGFHEVGE